MRPITPESLQAILDTDIVWRRREITSIYTTAQLSDAAVQSALIRAGVPLLYAHWEGFGKSCFQRYLEFVSYKNLRYSALNPSFSYLATSGIMQEVYNNPPATAISLIPSLFSVSDKVNRNSFRKSITTKSNLRFVVLKDLLALCGFNSDPFLSYSSFVDTELCDARNEIAHGAGATLPLGSFARRRDRTFELMALLQNTIVNAAVTGAYLK